MRAPKTKVVNYKNRVPLSDDAQAHQSWGSCVGPLAHAFLCTGAINTCTFPAWPFELFSSKVADEECGVDGRSALILGTGTRETIKLQGWID